MDPEIATPRDAGGRDGEWPPARRLAFRFAFVFLAFVYLPFPGIVPDATQLYERYAALWKNLTPLIGRHLLGLAEPVRTAPTGSGDTTHHWILLLCQLALSLGIALLWSSLDRRKTIHPWWVEGLRLYLRYGLAFVMLTYGFSKILPGQFPPPGLDQLLAPLGSYSPMGLLWAFMGASQGYTHLAGAAEVLGGVLLLFRRTTLLGALLSAAILFNVLALNLFYDVPVKLYSAQLLLTALYLILPDARRLADLLVWNRPVPSRDLAMPPAPRRVRIAIRSLAAALVVFYLVDFNLENGFLWEKEEKSPLYGVYEVETFAVGGEELPPLLGDEKRWRRVVFGESRLFAAQKMDEKSQRWRVKSIDEPAGRIELVGARLSDKRTLSFQRTADGLLLEGRFGDDAIVARLRRLDLSKFELNGRGFHWINEFPYNRH